MKYLEQLNVLNILLVLIVVLMGVYEYHDFTRKDNLKVSPSKNMRLDTGEVKLDYARKLLARGDYMEVTEKNLFHPDRKPVKSQTDAPLPEFIVYGTISGATNAAFVEDKKSPYSTAGRGQRQRMLHQGDTLSGYIVSNITTEYVEFTKNGEKLIVKVIDFEKKKVRQPGESTKAAVVPPSPPPPHIPQPPIIPMQTPPVAQMPSMPAIQMPGAKSPVPQMPPMPMPPVPVH
ncbi:MAG: hypothetical protein HQK99_14045 [Nitrospirae bacterium]|nr:hypothetical protein [Nitrospirota bacterium]